MEKLQGLAEKTKKLSASFEKDIDDLLKGIDSGKSQATLELKICVLYENLVQVNQFLCEMKVMILQMRYDLHNISGQEKNKGKMALDLYNAEELYQEMKEDIFKILDDIIEKRNKTKFTLHELEVWKDVQAFITSVSMRVNF